MWCKYDMMSDDARLIYSWEVKCVHGSPRPALLPRSPGLGSASRLPVVLHPPCRHQDLASVDTVDSDGAWAEFQCGISEHYGEERRQHTTQQERGCKNLCKVLIRNDVSAKVNHPEWMCEAEEESR